MRDARSCDLSSQMGIEPVMVCMQRPYSNLKMVVQMMCSSGGNKAKKKKKKMQFKTIETVLLQWEVSM